MKFNEASLRAIKPGAKDIYFWDESFKGNRNGRFGLRVYPSGAKRYVYDYISESGKRRRMVIGDHGCVSLADARAIAKEYAREVYRGKDPELPSRVVYAPPVMRPTYSPVLPLFQGAVRSLFPSQTPH